MNRHDTGEVTFFTFDLLGGIPGMVHAVSTRSGGVSRAPFDSLNLAFHVGDDPEAVLENRERFAAAVGFTCDEVVTTRQVHGRPCVWSVSPTGERAPSNRPMRRGRVTRW